MEIFSNLPHYHRPFSLLFEIYLGKIFIFYPISKFTSNYEKLPKNSLTSRTTNYEILPKNLYERQATMKNYLKILPICKPLNIYKQL